MARHKPLLLFLLAAFTAAAAAQPRPGRAVLLRGVTVVDVSTGRLRGPEDVLVLSGRIAEIGRRIDVRSGVQVIPAAGKFLIPGLWDMHVHVLGNERAAAFFDLFIANGVTGVRDMGTTAAGFASLAEVRQDIASGKLPGPRIVAAGRILDGPQPVVPENSIAISGETSAREAVRFLKRSGADFIKVYDGITRPDYFTIIDEAKKLSIPVAGHVPTTGITAFEASDAGQRSFEHLANILRTCSSLEPAAIDERAKALLEPGVSGLAAIPARIAARTKIEIETFDPGKCQTLYAAFVKNGTWQVPTLVTKRPLSLIDDGTFFNDARMKYIPAAELEDWKPENNFFLKYRTPEFIVQKKALYRKELELVRDMHRAGVAIMAGSDIPGAYTYPGFSLHDELQLFVENGFTPLDALRTATIGPATYLGLDRSLGTVEKGKLADLVLLDADPTIDIKNTTKIAAVISGGKYYSKADLKKMLNRAETGARSKE